MREMMRRTAAILTAAVLVSTAVAAEPAAPEWPGWRGPNRDGKSPDIGLLKQWPPSGPKLLWKVDDLGDGYSSVAVVGGRVYITGDVDRRDLVLHCFDLAGKRQWRKKVDAAWTGDHPGSRSTPMIHLGRLYLVSGKVALATCSPDGMAIKGQFSVDGSGPSWAHPVVIGGRLYLRYANNLYCYDVKAKP